MRIISASQLRRWISFRIRHSLRPIFHVTAITHRKDAVYPATIVGIPPMEDFYIGGAALTPSPSPIGWERGWG